MSVTYRKELYCICKWCYEELMLDQLDVKTKYTNIRTLKAEARRKGWHLDRNECWCPECSKRKGGKAYE